MNWLKNKHLKMFIFQSVQLFSQGSVLQFWGILVFHGEKIRYIGVPLLPLEPISRKSRNFSGSFPIWHNSLCILKTKASRAKKLSSYLNVYTLYNI